MTLEGCRVDVWTHFMTDVGSGAHCAEPNVMCMGQNEAGIFVKQPKGQPKFYPWTSVAYVELGAPLSDDEREAYLR